MINPRHQVAVAPHPTSIGHRHLPLSDCVEEGTGEKRRSETPA